MSGGNEKTPRLPPYPHGMTRSWGGARFPFRQHIAEQRTHLFIGELVQVGQQTFRISLLPQRSNRRGQGHCRIGGVARQLFEPLRDSLIKAKALQEFYHWHVYL